MNDITSLMNHGRELKSDLIKKLDKIGLLIESIESFLGDYPLLNSLGLIHKIGNNAYLLFDNRRLKLDFINDDGRRICRPLVEHKAKERLMAEPYIEDFLRKNVESINKFLENK